MIPSGHATEHSAVLTAPAQDALDTLCATAEKNGFTVARDASDLTITAPLGQVRFRDEEGHTRVAFSSENPAKLQLLKDLYAERFAKLGLDTALTWDPVAATAPLNQMIATVQSKTRISPSFMRVRLAGDFRTYAPEDAGLHFRMLFGPDDAGWPTLDARGLTVWPGGVSTWHRPPYTVRAIDPGARWIDVDIVLHDGGRVTAWCETAALGDEIALHGPNGGGQPEAGWLGLVGDETALPVIARTIEAASAETRGQAVIMVRDPADAQTIPTASQIKVHWAAMDPTSDPADVLGRLDIPTDDRFVFFAAEKAQATRAREVFRTLGLGKGEAKAASYWSLPQTSAKPERKGAANGSMPKPNPAVLYGAPDRTPQDHARRLMRCTQIAAVAPADHAADGGAMVACPVASDLSGAPLLHLPDESLAGQGGALQVLLIDGARALHLSGHAEAIGDDRFARERFEARHGRASGPLFRLVLEVATLQEGAAKTALTAGDLLTQSSDDLAEMERRAVDHMNDDHLDAIKLYAEALLGAPEGDWRLAALDMEGLDLTAGPLGRRLWFDPPLSEPQEIKQRLIELAITAKDR